MADQNGQLIGRWLIRRRMWVQTAFLMVWLDPLMLRLHNVCGPVFHCYSCPWAMVACPIGVLANFSALHLWPLLAIGMLFVVGSLFGSAVCGWACPFGWLQDVFARIPTPKFKLPNWAGHTRYAVLIGLVIVIPYMFGQEHPLFFCRVCPAGALEGAIPNTVQTALAGDGWIWPNAAKMTIVVGVLVAMLFTLRPWCTLFCPLGAIFSLFNRFSILVLRFRGTECKECGACDQMCRYGVLPAVDVNNVECIRCMECTKCNALTVSHVLSPPIVDEKRPHPPIQRANRTQASAS